MQRLVRMDASRPASGRNLCLDAGSSIGALRGALYIPGHAGGPIAGQRIART
jgi:hypothetical protein